MLGWTIYNESSVNKFMTVGKNDLHENELFSLINIVTAIKTGIKNPNKTATNAFLLRNAKQKMSLKNVFHIFQGDYRVHSQDYSYFT